MGAIAIAGLVVAIVGSAVSAYASYEQGQTQQKIGRYNQKIAEQSAQARKYEAAIEAENLRDKYAMILAAQRAGIGGSGVLGSEGSPLLVQLDSEEQAALNERRAIYSGEAGASAAQAEAIQQGYIGKRAGRQGTYQAGGSLLSGTSAALNTYASYRQSRPAKPQGEV